MHSVGSVVRISPNELSFSSVTSWKAIYGHTAPGKPTLVKSKFYEMYGAGFDSGCIGSERDPKTHNQMKRLLSAAFSTKALSEQEDIVQQCIDGFIDRIGHDGAGPQGLDVSEWYEMVAFDILGEMAFGESFHCVDKGSCSHPHGTITGSGSLALAFVCFLGEPHFWPELILKHLFFITLLDNLRRYPLLVSIGKYVLPRWTVDVRNKHTGYSRDQVSR